MIEWFAPHFYGSGQTMRLIFSIIICLLSIQAIGKAITEPKFKFINLVWYGGFFLAGLGVLINSAFSVLDALAVFFPALVVFNASINTITRQYVIGSGTWVTVAGFLLISIGMLRSN